MAGFSFQIEGMEEFQKTLDAAKKDGCEKAIRRALRAGADLVQTAIQAKAPERVEDTPSGTALPPGALKADVIVSNVKQLDAETQSYSVRIGMGKETAHVAGWVEYGHRQVHGGRSSVKSGKVSGSGSVIGNVPAHPFFRPAYEESEQAAQEAINIVLDTELTKALGE